MTTENFRQLLRINHANNIHPKTGRTKHILLDISCGINEMYIRFFSERQHSKEPHKLRSKRKHNETNKHGKWLCD